MFRLPLIVTCLLAVLGGLLGARPAFAQSNELVVGLATDPLTLDPRGAMNIVAWSLAYHITDPLVGKDPDLKLVPMLATSWERLDDRTWRFHLRKGVRFSNGEAFTSKSVKATIDAMINPQLTKGTTVTISSIIRGGLLAIDRVETPDPYTVVIVTKAPNRPLLVNLSLLGIAPASALTDGAAYVAKPVGTGPYRLVEYVPGARVVLAANPDYWGKKPAFTRVVFRIMRENATRIAALETGEVMAITNVPPDAIDRIERHPNLEVLETLTSRYTYLYLQNDRPPFNDRRIRLAVNHALDKEAIVRGIFRGHGKVASAPMGPATTFFNKSLQPYPHDVQRAKQLLAEAGYPNGLPITMGTPYGRFINDRLVGEAAAGQLRKAGFKVDLKVEEWGTSLSNLMKRTYDAMFGGYGGSTDPDYMLSWLFTAKSSVIGFSSPELEKLLEEGRQSFDEGKARTAYEKAQRLIWEDAPLGFLYDQPEIVAINKRLKGFGPRPDEYLDLRNAHFE